MTGRSRGSYPGRRNWSNTGRLEGPLTDKTSLKKPDGSDSPEMLTESSRAVICTPERGCCLSACESWRITAPSRITGFGRLGRSDNRIAANAPMATAMMTAHSHGFARRVIPKHSNSIVCGIGNTLTCRNQENCFRTSSRYQVANVRTTKLHPQESWCSRRFSRMYIPTGLRTIDRFCCRPLNVPLSNGSSVAWPASI